MNKSLITKDLQETICHELSGERAKDFIISISRFDRVQASPGTYKCMEMVKDILSSFAVDNTIIERFPADGEIKYGTWSTCMGWNIREAELWIKAPHRQKLADYGEIPVSVVRGSQSVNVTAELVDVGSGLSKEEYTTDVKGKIVLAGGPVFSTYARSVHREAVIKRGALGIVLYRDPQMDFRNHQTQLIPYYGMWNSYQENNDITFGFTLSFEVAMQLKNIVKNEKIVLNAYVDGENYKSTLDQMMCSIPGSKYPDEEVLLMAHMDHYQPGAQDNASGSAALLEIARTIKKLIVRGDILPPKRTIRFLWPTEFSGMTPWIQKHVELTKKTLAAINCDMIGGDLVKTQAYLQVMQTPFSQPHYINNVIENLTNLVATLDITSPRGNNKAPFNSRFISYQGGSDHLFLNDSSINIPAAMLGQKDPFYHTAHDVPDNIDPTQLKRAMFIALGSVLYLSNAESTESIELNALSTSSCLKNISNTEFKVINTLTKSKDQDLHVIYKRGLNQLQWQEWHAIETIHSVSELDKEKIAQKWRQQSQKQIQLCSQKSKEHILQVYEYLCQTRNLAPQKITLSEKEIVAQKRIPKRNENFVGPLSVQKNIQHQMGESTSFEQMAKFFDIQYEIVNFIDGKRSIFDIYKAVSAIYGPQSLAVIEKFLDNLKQEKLIRYI